MTTQEIREQAAQLIERDGAWAQGYYAYDSAGLMVDPLAPSACRWCLMGALVKVSGDIHEADQIVVTMRHEVGTFVTDWNDARERTQAEVVSALRGTYRPPEVTR